MKRRAIVITGTDTGVGKTVLATLLARYWRRRGISVAALKPVASGDRADARAIHAALDGALALEEINPWCFRAPIAPRLAARRERRRVRLTGVLAHVRAMQKRFDVVLLEGAGGLLSPLGDDFDSRDLIAALHAVPVIAGPNRIGVVNQVRLILEALPRPAAARARVVLMSPARPDAATETNADLLAEYFDPKRICELPWLGRRWHLGRALADAKVRRTLQALIRS